MISGELPAMLTRSMTSLWRSDDGSAVIEGAVAVGKLYAGTNRVHPDGTLRTRHLTTNVIVDIDDGGETATARSAFVVFQATPDVPLQPIVAGRYHDEFACADGSWHFARRHILLEQVGNVSDHLKIDL